MGQEFHVVRCFSCQSFQVQQVKKVNRWSCKLCGEKQSLKKEFGRGSGADCRRHVQKLNAMRGAVMEKQEHNTLSLWKQAEEEEEEQEQEQETPGSRWSKYLDPPEEAEPEDEDEDNVLMDRQQLHGNNTADRKRKRRETRTDGGRSSHTPEQSIWSSTTSAKTTSSPSPSLNRTSPSLNRTSPSLNRPSSSLKRPSPSLNRPSPPSMISGPACRWSSFLSSSESQMKGAEPLVNGRSHMKGAEPQVSGRSPVVGGAASLPCNDVITQAPPFPRPLLPVSSMFESGEDFSFDDF